MRLLGRNEAISWMSGKPKLKREDLNCLLLILIEKAVSCRKFPEMADNIWWVRDRAIGRES
jgi:hypothetical protein